MEAHAAPRPHQLRCVTAPHPAAKFEAAKQWGATDCVNPKDHPDKPIQAVLVEASPSGWGLDYTFECIGNVEVGGWGG